MRFRIVLALLLLVIPAAAQAPGQQSESAPPAPKDVRDTPRGAFLGFLAATAQGDYRRASSFLNIRPEHRRRVPPDELARDLQEILNRKLGQDPGRLSAAPEGDLTDGLDANLELLGTIRQRDGNVDLLLERVNGIWLISSSTVSLIPAIHADIGVNPIERHLPSWLLREGAFDTAVWQWLALALLTLLALGLGHFLARALIRTLRPIVRRTQSELDDKLIGAISRPIQLLIALALYRIGIAWIAPSYLLRTYLGRILTGLIYLAIAWVLVRFIDVATTKLLAAMSGRQRTSAGSVMPLARRSLKVLAIAIAILATLSSWGYDTTALLAGLGVGGLAVALAAQKTIENLFGGIALTSDKPVLVGDFCRYGDKTGTVEDIGLRSTRIRTQDRTVVTVPNAEFSSLQIENFARRDKIWFRPILQLRKDTQPAQIRGILARLRELMQGHEKIEPTPRVRFLAVAAHSVDIEIFSYVLTADYAEFLAVQEELLLRILEIVSEEGTALAVPTQLNFLTRDTRRPTPS
jgi:MscS family membrane protein